jgi:hypothetical protein
MKINLSSSTAYAKVDAALKATNGGATTHTVTEPEKVIGLAEEIERIMEKAGLPPAHRAGAEAEFTSGKGLRNAYRYTGIATRLIFRRGSKAWFLVGVERAPAYPGDTSRPLRIRISDEQERRAREAMRRNHGIEITKAAVQPAA